MIRLFLFLVAVVSLTAAGKNHHKVHHPHLQEGHGGVGQLVMEKLAGEMLQRSFEEMKLTVPPFDPKLNDWAVAVSGLISSHGDPNTFVIKQVALHPQGHVTGKVVGPLRPIKITVVNAKTRESFEVELRFHDKPFTFSFHQIEYPTGILKRLVVSDLNIATMVVRNNKPVERKQALYHINGLLDVEVDVIFGSVTTVRMAQGLIELMRPRTDQPTLSIMLTPDATSSLEEDMAPNVIVEFTKEKTVLIGYIGLYHHTLRSGLVVAHLTVTNQAGHNCEIGYTLKVGWRQSAEVVITQLRNSERLADDFALTAEDTFSELPAWIANLLCPQLHALILPDLVGGSPELPRQQRQPTNEMGDTANIRVFSFEQMYLTGLEMNHGRGKVEVQLKEMELALMPTFNAALHPIDQNFKKMMDLKFDSNAAAHRRVVLTLHSVNDPQYQIVGFRMAEQVFAVDAVLFEKDDRGHESASFNQIVGRLGVTGDIKLTRFSDASVAMINMNKKNLVLDMFAQKGKRQGRAFVPTHDPTHFLIQDSNPLKDNDIRLVVDRRRRVAQLVVNHVDIFIDNKKTVGIEAIDHPDFLYVAPPEGFQPQTFLTGLFARKPDKFGPVACVERAERGPQIQFGDALTTFAYNYLVGGAITHFATWWFGVGPPGGTRNINEFLCFYLKLLEEAF